MGFILGCIALIAAYFVWSYRYNDATFHTHMGATLGDIGQKWRHVFWIALGFAVWAMILNFTVPAAVALVFYAFLTVMWLVSDAGKRWLHAQGLG